MTAGDGNDDGDGNVKAHVRQYWNRRSESYDDEAHHAMHTEEQRERWLTVLDEWTPDPSVRTLDVGCGTGEVTALLAALGHEVTGVDITPGMLERARRKARTDGTFDVHRGDAERLPVADDALDLVTARHLVWTLPDPGAAIEEFQRVLVPGGRILLIEGHWDHDEPFDEYEAIHDDLPLYDGRPPEELRAFLERRGVEGIDCELLSDPVLWGREPEYEYYAMAGEVGD